MMKRCELCKSKARVHCESDQASLCWTCDANVHSANFLVARHSRNLLCHVCRSPTQWCASGGKVKAAAFAVCEKCVGNRRRGEEEEEVVEENQLVPWSPPPQEADCSSSSDEESAIGGETTSTGKVSRKRLRSCGAASSDLPIERYEDCRNRAPPLEFAAEEASGVVDSSLSTKPSSFQKLQKMESGQAKVCGSGGLMEALRRFHREETGPGGGMVEVRTIRGPSI